MTFDEAIKILDQLSNATGTADEYLLACEMGSMALTILIEEHDRISGVLRHYNEIDEVHDD